MFSKTDFTKGVVAAVPIIQCVSVFEILVMAADEYIQIQRSYRRFLSTYLVAAEKALLLQEGDPSEYLTKGYNLINLKTGNMRYETQSKVKICRLSCAYRSGTYYAAEIPCWKSCRSPAALRRRCCHATRRPQPSDERRGNPKNAFRPASWYVLRKAPKTWPPDAAVPVLIENGRRSPLSIPIRHH